MKALITAILIIPMVFLSCANSSDKIVVDNTVDNLKKQGPSIVSLFPVSQTAIVESNVATSIYFDGTLTGVEAATFRLYYDQDVLTPIDVVEGEQIENNTFLFWEVEADGEMRIDVGVLDGDFDGPDDFVKIIWTADAIGSSPIIFMMSSLRDAMNQSIPHIVGDAGIDVVGRKKPDRLEIDKSSESMVNE